MAWNKILLTGVAAALVMGAAGAANAQGYYDEERVIVRPSSPIYGNRSLPSTRGAGDRLISVSLPVNISDLDLSSLADREELAYRVHMTAVEVCSRLDSRYPRTLFPADTDSRTCIRDASNNAIAMAHDIRYGRY